MRALKGLALAAALAAAGTASSAQLVLDGVHWQIGKGERGRISWQDGRTLSDGPPKLVSRLRARVVLKNRGAAAVQAVLLRTSMTLRLTLREGKAAAGTWAIPFSVDDRRVPRVGAGKTLEVFLESGAALDLRVRDLARAGWWPDRIKMQVMVDPRPGTTSIQTAEDVLEIQR